MTNKPLHFLGAARSCRAATTVSLLALLFLTACGDQGDAHTPAPVEHASPVKGDADHKEAGLVLTADDMQRAGMKVETLAASAVAGTITVTATIRANQDRIARVAPRVEGRVLRVSANLGDVVRQGQTLAALDSVAIGEAQSTLQHAQSAQRVAQADYARAESLVADEIIPRRDFLKARAELEKASTDQRLASDRLRLLGGTPAQGRAEASFQLVAPMAGTIVEKKATVGQLSMPSEALFVVADLSTLWIEADLTEDTLARVKRGASATVVVNAFPGERFKGRVTYVAAMLSKESRTVPARIEVANDGGRLKPEMFATATIETGGISPPALSVPDGAILLLQGQPTVFVQEGAGFEGRAVELGDKVAGRTVVKSGLVAGDKVVTAGAYALKARLLKSQISDEH